MEALRTRRVFSEEFQQDAVRLVVSENYTFAAAAGTCVGFRTSAGPVIIAPAVNMQSDSSVAKPSVRKRSLLRRTEQCSVLLLRWKTGETAGVGVIESLPSSQFHYGRLCRRDCPHCPESLLY